MKLSDVAPQSTKLSQVSPGMANMDSGPVATSEATQRGVVSSILGFPGEIQQAVNAPFNMAFRAVGLPEAGHWPTTGEFEQMLPGKELAEQHPVAQAVGEAIPALVPLGGATGKAAVTGAKEIGKIASDILPGATEKAAAKVTDIGPTTDEGILGEKMHKDLMARYDKLIETRQKQIDAIKKEYLSQPNNVERGIALSYRQILSNYMKNAARDLTPDEKKMIVDLQSRIGGDPSMTRIESERRFLGKIASGKMQSYEAIRTQVAQDIKNQLEDLIRKRVPAGGKFIDAYRDLSEPINMFESTTGGKRLVSEASPYLKDTPKYAVEILPKEFFKNRSSIKNLLTLSGGDEKFVSAAAGEFAASKLKGLTPTEARTWLKKNDSWLSEVPKVKKTVEQYVERLERVTYTHERAKKAIDAAAYGTAAATGGVTSYWILKHLLGM